MSVLSIRHLAKSFGDKPVIHDLSLDVPENTIYGFLGQNGAGKTTTMKMVLGLIKPTGGTINVCGETVNYGDTKTNRHIGYLPDVPEFYGYMKPMEYLMLCGEVTGLDRKRTRARAEELLALVGLEKANKRIAGFSRGMKQRLGIAQALLNEPKLLICDEPTSALDPVGRKEILDILKSVKGKTTILFSTHILSDVERICDRAAVLHNGRLVLEGSLSELKQSRRTDKIAIEFASAEDAGKFADHLASRERFSGVEQTGRTLMLTSDHMETTREQIYAAFHTLKLYPEKVEVLEPTLESLFMEVIR